MKDYSDEIEDLIAEEGGYLRIRAAEDRGIARAYVYRYLEAHTEIEKAAKGIYVRKDMPVDRLYILSLRNKDIVFSHLTAAWLLKLLPEKPHGITVTVPQGYNATHLIDQFIDVIFTERESAYLGKGMTKTESGKDVPAFNLERTICDLIRQRSRCDKSIYQTAMKNAFASENLNLDLLREYAETFHIQGIVEEYILILR